MTEKILGGRPGSSMRWAFLEGFGIGADGDPYLDRLRIIQTPWFGIYLHHIHRPDRERRRLVERRHTSNEHARRVAWRVLKVWLEAQLALIEAGLADLAEIMLPWMKVDQERTLYAAYQDDQRKALESR